MGWTQAAWAVKKIEQDLNIPIFINAYMTKLEELKNLVNTLENQLPESSEIEEALFNLKQLSDSITRAQQAINIVSDGDQAFFAINSGNTPSGKDNIKPNSIWFVLGQ